MVVYGRCFAAFANTKIYVQRGVYINAAMVYSKWVALTYINRSAKHITHIYKSSRLSGLLMGADAFRWLRRNGKCPFTTSICFKGILYNSVLYIEYIDSTVQHSRQREDSV